MGLGRGLLIDLIELRQNGVLDGCVEVIEIGSQQLSDGFLNSGDLLDTLYQAFGRDRPTLGAPVGEEKYTEMAPPSEPFWTSLGLTYSTVDFGGHRGSIPIDLNCDIVPDHLRGKFHLVVNAGTTEHVANQDNAFRIIHDLTAPAGIMLHEVPAGAFGDHGLISYNPKFFNHLCYCNGYRTLLREDRPETIRAALMKLGSRTFATPMDLPAGLMPREPYRLRRAVDQLVPGSRTILPPISRLLRRGRRLLRNRFSRP